MQEKIVWCNFYLHKLFYTPEWIRRNKNDQKIYGTLFFDMCEDIQDVELVDPLKSLIKLFIKLANGFTTENTTTIQSKLKDLPSKPDLFRLCFLIYAVKVAIIFS